VFFQDCVQEDSEGLDADSEAGKKSECQLTRDALNWLLPRLTWSSQSSRQ
jgi:hypothetical protein